MNDEKWLQLRAAAQAVNEASVRLWDGLEGKAIYHAALVRLYMEAYPDHLIELCDEHQRVCDELAALKATMRGLVSNAAALIEAHEQAQKVTK